MKNSYFKGHGLGNEYIVLDPRESTIELTPGRITRICDRQKGIGSDGVLTLEDSDSADFGLRIWNPDGSEAETSGNGLRIFALYLHATGRTRKRSLAVETAGGTVRVETRHDHRGASDGAGSESAGSVGVEDRVEAVGAEDENGPVTGATVHMGPASFSPEALPCTFEAKKLVEQPINIAGEALIFTGVSVGNPHCVVFPIQDRRRGGENPNWQDVDQLHRQEDRIWHREDLLRLGPVLETHAIFPQRTNVQLAEPTGPNTIRILIWERGAGETPSSGSSACAAASAAVRLGLVRSPVTVESPGGELLVDVDEGFNLTLTGPVDEVVQGTFSAAMLREILDADDQLQTT